MFKGLFTFSSGYLNKWIQRNDMHAYPHSFPLSVCLHIPRDKTSNYVVNTISRTATFKNKDLHFIFFFTWFIFVGLLQEAYRDTWVSTWTLVNSSNSTYGTIKGTQ